MTALRGPVSRTPGGWACPGPRRSAGFAALLALLAWLGPGEAGAGERLRSAAPRFKVESLAGQKLELETLRLRGPVLIDFWATWCKPCVTAIPELEKIHRDYDPRGLTVIGVAVDGPRSFAKVRPTVGRLGMTYPIVLDQDGSLQQKYQIRAMPTTVLVDTSGAIVHVMQGFRPGEGKRLRKLIDELLPSP